jgi:hypothetical protein
MNECIRILAKEASLYFQKRERTLAKGRNSAPVDIDK